MTRIISLPLVLFTVVYSCGQSNNMTTRHQVNSKTENNKNTSTETQFYLDTSVIAILPIDSSISWFFKEAKPITITNFELSNVERLLINCINIHNAKQDTTKQFSEFIDLKKYRRQYVPFLNSKGERSVYINCFCRMDWVGDDWKKSILLVDDGGICFFQVTINLTKLILEHFSTNGYG